MTATRTRAIGKALPAGLLGAWLATQPQKIDEERILKAIGDWTVGSHASIARAFGVSPNTIKQSWAAAGMPGRLGCYKLGPIFVWRARYERELAAKKPRAELKSADARQIEADARQIEADARKTELQVEKLEIEMAEASGRLIDREVAGSAFRSILSQLTEGATTIGTELETEFALQCKACGAAAKDKADAINRMFGRLLTMAAEKGARVVQTKRGDVDL